MALNLVLILLFEINIYDTQKIIIVKELSQSALLSTLN